MKDFSEHTVCLRYSHSSMPKKKKLHHYWTTYRHGVVTEIEGYDYLGSYVRDGVRIHLHSNLPEWLYSDDLKKKALRKAYMHVRYPRKQWSDGR